MLILMVASEHERMEKPSELFLELKETCSPTNQPNIGVILLDQLRPGCRSNIPSPSI